MRANLTAPLLGALHKPRGLGKFVLSAPIRPTRASVAAYAFVFAGPSDKEFTAWTCRHLTGAIPLDKDFVPVRVRHDTRPICSGTSLLAPRGSAIEAAMRHAQIDWRGGVDARS